MLVHPFAVLFKVKKVKKIKYQRIASCSKCSYNHQYSREHLTKVSTKPRDFSKYSMTVFSEYVCDDKKKKKKKLSSASDYNFFYPYIAN